MTSHQAKVLKGVRPVADLIGATGQICSCGTAPNLHNPGFPSISVELELELNHQSTVYPDLDRDIV